MVLCSNKYIIPFACRDSLAQHCPSRPMGGTYPGTPRMGLRVRPPSQVSESGFQVGSPSQTAIRFGPKIRGGVQLGCESGGSGRPRLGLKQSPFHEPFITLQSCASALYSFYFKDTYSRNRLASAGRRPQRRYKAAVTRPGTRDRAARPPAGR